MPILQVYTICKIDMKKTSVGGMVCFRFEYLFVRRKGNERRSKEKQGETREKKKKDD
jgi:hypothetical protein